MKQIEKTKRFKVYNTDEHFGDEEAEYFDTLKEAEDRWKEIFEELFDLNVEEVHREADEELCHQIGQAIQIDEEEDEED